MQQGVAPLRYRRHYLKPVAAVLRRHMDPDELLLSDDPRFAWYARGRFLALGILDAESLAREAQSQGVRLLVTDRRELGRRVPGFDAAKQAGEWQKIDLGKAGEGWAVEPVAFEFTGKKN